jgi:hypothetical protein
MDITRSTVGTYVDPTGRIRTADIDVPRITWKDGKASYLVEEARTNLLLWSEDFDNAYWTKTRASISANVTTAPDGANTADKLVEDTTASDTHFLNTPTFNFVAGSAYTLSVFVKPAGRANFSFVRSGPGGASASFDLTAVSAVNQAGSSTPRIISVGNGWFHCTMSWTASSTANRSHSILLSDESGVSVYTGDGTSGIYIWGAQLEQGATPSSYIKTEASQGERLADNAVRDLSTMDGWNPREFTVYCEYDWLHDNAPTDSDFAPLFSLGNTSNTQRLSLGIISNDARLLRRSDSTGLGFASQSLPSSAAFRQGKRLMLTYTLTNGADLYIDGVRVLNGIYPNVDLSTEGVRLVIQGVRNLFKLGDFKIYPKALTEAEAIALTTI